MVSIIVPVLNEAKGIEAFLRHLLELDGDYEVIVVDGGSQDGTAELASRYVRVISAERGRARQMNAGARVAQGNVFLFLHADCRLPQGAIEAIEAALADLSCVGGCFTLALDEDGAVYRLLAFLARVRMWLTGRMTGDEGIFVRREVFERMGGFPDIPLMEDWEFSARLRAYGRVRRLPLKIIASARRWREWGIWRTFWLMQKLKLLYALGVPPAELRKLYEDVR